MERLGYLCAHKEFSIREFIFSKMMIAFITLKGGFVHFSESLCAQIYFRFEIIGGFAFTSFAFLFRKEKYVSRNKQLVQLFVSLLVKFFFWS